MEKVIVANHKMFFDSKGINQYMKKILKKNLGKRVIFCPSYIYLPYFLKNTFSVGVQNISKEVDGKSTGEISASQVKSLGVKYVILGHSERKIKFNEQYTNTNKKVRIALNNKLIPIICIGEMKKEDNSQTVIKKELTQILKGIKGTFVIAYEPVWAIGTQSMSNKQITTNVTLIKDIIKKEFNFKVPVLYGGNVNINNIQRLNKIPNVDGFLIGDASTRTEEFLKIIEVVEGQ